MQKSFDYVNNSLNLYIDYFYIDISSYYDDNVNNKNTH